MPDGHSDKPSYYNNLGVALQLRFECLNDLTDLEMAITNLESAVRFTPDGHPDKPSHYNNLGNFLQRRFQRLWVLSDLEMAITNLESAVKLTPDGHPNKPFLYSNLESTLQFRLQNLDALSNLEMAITNLENVVRLMPDGHPHKLSHHNNLGDVLQLRFERLGALSDLELAITNLENAVRLTPDEHPNKPLLYSNLGSALQFRFERLGALSDLKLGIANLENAVRLTPYGHPDKPSHYSDLGNVLQRQFKHLGDLFDLERAITNMEIAVKFTPNGHPNKPSLYSNLGNALQCRFQRLDALFDLEMAITNLENAVRLTPDGHQNKPSHYGNLGTYLQYRFNSLGDLSDIERAISNLENAVRLMPDGYPDKVLLTFNLARSYEAHFNSSAEASHLELAHLLYVTTAQSPVSRPQQRFNAALDWSRCAKLTNNSPLPAFKCAIDQLPLIASLGIPVNEQHPLLDKIGDGVREAVAAAIEAEEYEMAVEWVEQGLSIMWQNLLMLRTPLDDLRAPDATVARELLPQTLLDGPQEEVAKSYTHLAIERDALVDKIRKISNFEAFLKPKGFHLLVPAAREGSAVILNVSTGRCDALALVPGDNGGLSVVSIPLTSFSLEQGEKLLLKLTMLLRQVGVRDGETRKPTQRPRNMDTQKEFKSILYTLWVAAVKPVLDGLAYQPQSSDLPRIWWCANGPLALLPIHAAGDYDATELGHKISDYVVSSYTPTLTAVLDSSYLIPSNDFKLLTVAQPSALGYPTIPKTMKELEQIAEVATSVSVISLTKEAATVERVQKAMRESHWVHLACHGKQNASKPIESGLILYDGTLKLSTIITQSLPNADFAFLLACQTAMSGQGLAAESVHLALECCWLDTEASLRRCGRLETTMGHEWLKWFIVG